MMTKTKLGRRLGTGKEAEVFEYGEHVVKLYKAAASKSSAFREAANLAIVETRGLPAPAVFGVEQLGECWGIVMGRATGPSFADAMRRQPGRAADYLKAMAELQLGIHRQPGTGLAGLKARLVADIGQVGAMLGEARQRRLLEGLAQFPDDDRLCHGDFHPWNILGLPGNATVVDWLDARSGPPAADVCRSYVLMRHAAPELASAYVEIYAGVAGCDRAGILAWLPFVAAARLAEGVPDEVDGLMAMVEATDTP